MNSGNRALSFLAVFLALVAAGSAFWAGEQVSLANQAGGVAREATFKSYRIAQSLKSLAAGYELTMNEFYSTVLEFPTYQKKSSDQKKAIERELGALANMQEGGAATASELTRLYKEMDVFRLALETAMTSAEKDWDGAREALFKMNVLSTRAIYQADLLGQSTNERAAALDSSLQAYQSQSTLYSRIAAGFAAFSGILFLLVIVRVGRA